MAFSLTTVRFIFGMSALGLPLPSAALAFEQEELKSARSLIAESGLAIELLSRGSITELYAKGLLDDAGKQLELTAATGDLDPELLPQIRSAQSAIANRNAALLNQISAYLDEIERQHE